MFVLHIYSVDKDGIEYYDYISTTIIDAFFGGLKKGVILKDNGVFPDRTIILIEKKRT